MAIISKSMEEILRSPKNINFALMAATTEEDIIRHMLEDGEISQAQADELIKEERRLKSKKAA